MPVDRERLRDTAKYLRGVRPLDPEELADYVEADHRVVALALRDEAADLGLVERDDGTFVPADGSPVRPRFDSVTAFPDEYAFAFEDLLFDEYGRNWQKGDSGKRLRETIRRLKEDYYRQHPVEYDYEAALGYGVYHLPDYYAAVQYALDYLARDGRIPGDLRVLDVGAGVGGPALGLHDYLPDDALVDYHAVEPSDAADVLHSLTDETGSNFHTELTRERIEEFRPDGEYDLVMACSVLSELDDPVAAGEKLLDALAPDGTVLALAPADRNTSIGLRETERELESRGATVYGPTVRFWPGERPTDTGWSFDHRPDIEPPGFQRRLAENAPRPSEFLNETVKFSYSLLRTDGERRYDVSLDESRIAKLADADAHVTNRVNLLVAKLSANLADEDANPVYKISDGSENQDAYAVHVNEDALNAALARAPYGSVLSIEEGLVLWNDDEAAYNVVIDEDTVVDRAR
ncbi:small ribosomal subunit Rsm22 family protein [Salarchaeum sp. JOR-1]|uniref:small ribosomal subunit Rsm22 family protein n=1 Tax=Salarchaeum sp. JOR-1 TaxID=2599399 RepID=UPI001198BFCB|nr:class I SAM-dependent methyltransferase [Salarchaeum sp. JOR-1]QDX40838.1 class I SAM-dependent methyltransferase [Salarchaeum sp. JOR-1]